MPKKRLANEWYGFEISCIDWCINNAHRIPRDPKDPHSAAELIATTATAKDMWERIKHTLYAKKPAK